MTKQGKFTRLGKWALPQGDKETSQNLTEALSGEDSTIASYCWIQQFTPLSSLPLALMELVPHCPASLLIS